VPFRLRLPRGELEDQEKINYQMGFVGQQLPLACHLLRYGLEHTNEALVRKGAATVDFTETWAYSWNVPIPAEDTRVTYPRGAATTGFSLIACGHSGADLFLAGAPFFFYRLYLQTGDRHYAEMARQLLYDTRQSMDINGSRGYGFPGLCAEALSLAPPRGRGVNTWVPWLSYSMMEPVVRLQQAYGMMDTPLLDDRQRKELLAKDQLFGRTRGLLTAKPRPSQDSSPNR
jgi:hypothetical protein